MTAPGPMRAALRCRDDRGTGQIGTIAAFMVFLCFLFLATHLLVGLYATSVVTAAAQDGAHMVASARVDHSDASAVARARREAEAHVRALLGRSGRRALLDWSASDADRVALRVRVPWPSLLPAIGDETLDREVDRTVEVRVERPR